MPDKKAVAVFGRYLMVDEIRLHYLEVSESINDENVPPVILIPGITSPAITWQFVGEALARYTRIFILDNRGRGLSSGGRGIGYSLSDYVGDLVGLIEQLDLKKPILLGHSMGGRIALKCAAERPDLLGKIIVADPPVSGPGRKPYPIPLQWYLDGIDRLSRGEMEDTSSPILKNWSKEQLQLRSEWLPTCDKDAIMGSYASFHEEDIHSLFSEIYCPTLLVYAENGNTVAQEDASKFVEKIHDCKAVRIDGVGHMMPWDDLDTFIKITACFLKDQESNKK